MSRYDARLPVRSSDAELVEAEERRQVARTIFTGLWYRKRRISQQKSLKNTGAYGSPLMSYRFVLYHSTVFPIPSSHGTLGAQPSARVFEESSA